MFCPKRSLCLFALVLLLPTMTVSAATISGRVQYEGAVPNLRPLSMDADPACAAKHDGPVASEVLVLGEDNAMANIFVQVKSGLPGDTYPTPEEAVVLDQDGCQYVPHVIGVLVGQPLKILNSDGVLHNVHALPTVNRPFNMAMPANRTEAVESFSKEEGIFKIKCDVHPWMNAWVAVLSHPFFDVTEADGTFAIKDLPAGTYQIEAWHERLKTKTIEVTVGDDETKTVDFVFSR